MHLRRAPLALLIIFSTAAAQAPSPTSPGTPVFHTQGRDVVVDLAVTDDKGAPISGLKASDFQVFENGKQQKIDFFEEHVSRALPPGEVKPLPPMPPNVYTNVPPAPESDSVNILLLDILNTPEQEFNYSRQQVMEFLKRVKPGTRIAIMTLGDHLRFVQSFTDDPAKLLAAVENTKNGSQGQNSSILATRGEQASDNQSIAVRRDSLAGASALGADAMADAFAQFQQFSLLNRSMMTLEALQDISRFVANIPGRKNLLWFSTEFPVFLLPNLSERAAMQELSQPLSAVNKTADMITAARIAVYPIEAEGLMNDSWFLADAGGAGNNPTYTGGANRPNMGAAANAMTISSLMGEASRRAAILQQMHQLADDTGGKAIYNNNLASAAARAIDDGSYSTYSPIRRLTRSLTATIGRLRSRRPTSTGNCRGAVATTRTSLTSADFSSAMSPCIRSC